MTKEKTKIYYDTYNAAFVALSANSKQELPQDLTTNSRNKKDFTGFVLKQSAAKVKEDGTVISSNEETIFNIASIAKTFTAATIVQVITNEEFQEYFDKNDPLATKISNFEQLIEKHGSENEKKYFQELKTKHPKYQEITLRHLLNHTSGILDNSWDFSDDFRKDQTKSFCLEDGKYLPPRLKPKEQDGNENYPLGESFGSFSYSNPAYEIAALIAKVTVREKRQQEQMSFHDLAKEFVINPLELKQTFTGSEMSFDKTSGKVFVKESPEILVAQGFDYYQGKLQTGQDFNFDIAAGGFYSTASDVAKFYQNLFNENFFKNNQKAKELFFDDKNFVASDEPRNTKDRTLETYGLGIRKIEDSNTQYFHHGGAGVGFYSHTIFQREKSDPENSTKTTSVLISYENLTRPIAEHLLKTEKKDKKGNFFVDEELAEKMQWLNEIFSQKELLELRNEFEKSSQNFDEKFDLMIKKKVEFLDLQTSKKPSSSPEKSFAEKMQQKSPKGFNEV